jgi:hypothetical protein
MKRMERPHKNLSTALSQVRLRMRVRLLTSTITIDPARRSGKPCIRDTRITVYDVLE